MSSNASPTGLAKAHGLTAREDLEAYDALPSEIRKLVREFPLRISAKHFGEEYSRFRSAGRSHADFVAHFVRVSAEKVPRATLAAYGPDHPSLFHFRSHEATASDAPRVNTQAS